MRNQDIHIRDPFVLCEDGVYYMYGTRAASFGMETAGFDVYISTDLEHWSDPTPCCDTAAAGLNVGANWAPEVHKYRGVYYMLATFTRGDCGLRGTFAFRAEDPKGPFLLHSEVLTPAEWECLDGTLYIDRKGNPYLVFCHEHTQIIDGTICYLPLSEDLSHAAGDPVFLDDGGHAMIFRGYDDRLRITFHSPNTPGLERPDFRLLDDLGDSIRAL